MCQPRLVIAEEARKPAYGNDAADGREFRLASRVPPRRMNNS